LRYRLWSGRRLHCEVLFVLIVLSHHRRKVAHFNVTENPTAQWAAQQSSDEGEVAEIAEVGGLHRHYERMAA
jgi:hypothetical protein